MRACAEARLPGVSLIDSDGQPEEETALGECKMSDLFLNGSLNKMLTEVGHVSNQSLRPTEE